MKTSKSIFWNWCRFPPLTKSSCASTKSTFLKAGLTSRKKKWWRRLSLFLILCFRLPWDLPWSLSDFIWKVWVSNTTATWILCWRMKQRRIKVIFIAWLICWDFRSVSTRNMKGNTKDCMSIILFSGGRRRRILLTISRLKGNRKSFCSNYRGIHSINCIFSDMKKLKTIYFSRWRAIQEDSCWKS